MFRRDRGQQQAPRTAPPVRPDHPPAPPPVSSGRGTVLDRAGVAAIPAPTSGRVPRVLATQTNGHRGPGAVWTYPGTVLRIISGDTLEVLLDLGLRLTCRTTVQLIGVDAPDPDTLAGRKATAFASGVIPAAARVTVHSHAIDPGGRLRASVTLPDGADLAGLLLGAGFAQRL